MSHTIQVFDIVRSLHFIDSMFSCLFMWALQGHRVFSWKMRSLDTPWWDRGVHLLGRRISMLSGCQHCQPGNNHRNFDCHWNDGHWNDGHWNCNVGDNFWDNICNAHRSDHHGICELSTYWRRFESSLSRCWREWQQSEPLCDLRCCWHWSLQGLVQGKHSLCWHREHWHVGRPTGLCRFGWAISLGEWCYKILTLLSALLWVDRQAEACTEVKPVFFFVLHRSLISYRVICIVKEYWKYFNMLDLTEQELIGPMDDCCFEPSHKKKLKKAFRKKGKNNSK